MQDLIKNMQTHATGANIHTVNKAITYLQGLADDGNILKDCFRQPDVVLEKLRTLCTVAVADNEWKPVDRYIRGWF